MNNESLKNEYRCLHSGDKTKWNQLTSLGEFIWDDVYIISLVAEDKSLGLPFEFEEDEVISIVVKDQSRDANNQNDRVIVQTLTRVERSTGNVLTYTRTRSCRNGEHKWSEWVRLGGAMVVVNQSETTVCIQPNVLNIWGEVAELNITLAEAIDKTHVNEYMLQFTSGDVATMLTLPADIRWTSLPNIQANKTYQISIINNLGVIGEFCDE